MIITIGGTGFIGKHILCALNDLKVSNETYSTNPDYEFLKESACLSKGFNISDLKNDEHESRIKNAHAVIYLASRSIPASTKNSLNQEIENNLKPAIDTIEYITNLNPNIRIIYLSSGGTVYGPNHKDPIPEESIINPVTPYSYGKIAIENYIQLLSNTSNVTYTILRASNPVGKWHANLKQGFIGAAIAKAREKKPIAIFGDGENIRDYVDADELAEALTMVLNNLSVSKNKIWNIGSGVGTTLNEIVTSLQKNFDHEITTEFLVQRKTDLAYNVLDCTKIKNELGWSAQLNIDKIIQKACKQAINN